VQLSIIDLIVVIMNAALIWIIVIFGSTLLKILPAVLTVALRNSHDSCSQKQIIFEMVLKSNFSYFRFLACQKTVRRCLLVTTCFFVHWRVIRFQRRRSTKHMFTGSVSTKWR